MPRTLEPVIMDEATDWSGQILSRQMTKYLFPDCIVRVAIHNSSFGGTEAIYFRITKMKDGTFWGIAQDTYRLDDYAGLHSGDQMTFRKEHINEIPISWQPKRFQKAVANVVGPKKGRRYAITGLRDVGI